MMTTGPAGSRFVAPKYVAQRQAIVVGRIETTIGKFGHCFGLVMSELDGYMLIDSTSEPRAAARREPVGPEMLGGGEAVI